MYEYSMNEKRQYLRDIHSMAESLKEIAVSLQKLGSKFEDGTTAVKDICNYATMATAEYERSKFNHVQKEEEE